ncbi:fibronectin type III domain-containing protein [Cryobacterium tepidiphilum]|uniref:Fibronectin type-III domain-containing protein n=1 Tax=Cryobacterium tepidiphilum TaxID=2486026 RepID=A0A3M8LRA3_9MICO|nr:fibronectin type III domain-containing protein [Cryobacterium tepidiphilum]RNE67409.1 hypothetical protein EEJ31_01185 [Cryobacterium tepidiphilum]
MRALRRSRSLHLAAVGIAGVVALGGLLAIPESAVAAGTLHLDQANDDTAAAGPMAAAGGGSSQTFVAGSSGALSRVEIYEYWYGWDAQTLSIYPANGWGGADQSQPPLAVTPVSGSGGPAWITADFTEPAQLVAGQKYALVRNGPGQMLTTGDRYPSGNPNVGSSDMDWLFRTYLDWSARISGGPGTVTVPVGSAYSSTYALSGTPNPALTVAIGALPPGLTLTADGIAGTPTATGTYDFTVQASNADGAATTTGSITVRPRIIPAVPSAITIRPAHNSALVSWTAGDPGDDAATFTVTASPGGASCATTGSECTVEGLDAFTAYAFSVTASSAAGTTIPTAPVSATTTDVPLAPTGLVVTGTDGGVHLAWQAAVERGVPVVGYRVEVFDGSAWTLREETEGTAADVTGLVNGTEYRFRVSADSFDGRSDFALAQAVPVGPASAPTALSVVSGPGSAVLTWTNPADDGGSDLSGYDVEYRTVGGDWTAALSGASSPATVTGLVDGTAYQFRIRAISAAGPGLWTTDPGVADTVQPFTFTGSFAGTSEGDFSGGETLRIGAPVGFDATGLPVGASVVLELHSSPLVLATSTVGADGEVHISTSLPANAEIGEHRLVATISGGNLAPQSLSSDPFAVALIAAYPTDGTDPTDGIDPDGTATAGTDPTTGTGATTETATRVTATPESRLAHTGSAGTGEASLLALALLAAGGVLTTVRRRRTRRS